MNKKKNTLLRTPSTWKRYQEHTPDGCPFCDTSRITVHGTVAITKNRFPYDAIAIEHDLLFPVRHVSEDGMNEEEWNDFCEFLEKVEQECKYDAVMCNFPDAQSIEGHFHVHLLKWERLD